eukprot:CAMPEP_0197258806 /NCGR_PEP_ID=MMETSP1429-20130617/83193_1 /TAXON_ID=49237 /ORGANISM="Chaetoceros  sp., Strain UNC1202" /LENGTH=43 /DNA_ID= /DNA_START= /DNA_END= /DNA_ORIENTATION=
MNLLDCPVIFECGLNSEKTSISSRSHLLLKRCGVLAGYQLGVA